MLLTNTEFSQETLNDLSDYFHGAPLGLHITTSDGTITRTNLAELELMGYRDHPDEYAGHHVAEFHADSESVQRFLDRLVAGESIAEHETTLIRRDGTPQKVLMYANAKTRGGEFRGVRCVTFPHPDDLRPEIAEVAALTDQSVESRGLDLTLDERNDLYLELQDFFDSSPVNLHMVGGDGLIKHASRSELASMGYTPDGYIGQHIARFHADQKVIDGMLEDLVGGTPLINFSATLFHKDGSKLPVMIYSNSRMREGNFVNTRCFTVPVPKARRPDAEQNVTFAWPRNEDFGFTIGTRETSTGPANPMTVALKYIASRKRPEESLGFLARISEVLGSGHPFDARLRKVLELSVPFLADFASVDTTSQHLAEASTPALAGRVSELVRILTASEPAVRRSGEVLTRLDLNASRSAGDGSAELLGMGIGSLVMARLAIRGEHIGVLSVLRENVPSRRRLGSADRALTEELARRIAFAIELERLSSRA